MALVIVTTSQMMIDHTETRNGDASTISTQAMYRADAWPTQPEQDELEENQRCVEDWLIRLKPSDTLVKH